MQYRAAKQSNAAARDVFWRVLKPYQDPEKLQSQVRRGPNEESGFGFES